MTKESRMNVIQCFKHNNTQEFQLKNNKFIKQAVYCIKRFRWLLHLKTYGSNDFDFHALSYLF